MPEHIISIRSYTRPTADVLLNGKTVRRFTAHSVDEARRKAIAYAEYQWLKFVVRS